MSSADYLQKNLKQPPGKEGVKIESIWEGIQYYLPGEIAGPERYSVTINWVTTSSALIPPHCRGVDKYEECVCVCVCVVCVVCVCVCVWCV